MLSGSAPLSPELVERFTARTGIPVHQGYGLTEAAPVVTSTLCSERLAARLGGCGAARHRASGWSTSRGRAPEGDDPGEIQISRRQPVQRLLARRRPAARTRTAGGPPATWASSTPRGDLFLVDRLKELVIVSGFNVYPVEVEEVIREVAGVTEVGGHRRRGRDHRRGGRRLRPSPPGPTRPRSQDAVRGTARSAWPGSSSPAGSRSSTSCPLTVTGKVQKGRLRGLERRRALGLLE